MKSIFLLVLAGMLYMSDPGSFAQAPDWLLAKSAGGTGSESGYSIAVDNSGNIFITGCFSSPTLAFGTFTLTNAGSTDMFIVKYDASGIVLWAKSAGGSNDECGMSVASDASGNILVTGYYSSTKLGFGSDTLTNAGTSDIFLVKYDTGGNVLWSRSAGGTGSDYGSSVVTDASGNAYLTGWFYSPFIFFGSHKLTVTEGGDLFLAKYDSHGDVRWAKSYGGVISNDYAESLAVDPSGNIYMTGYYSGVYISFEGYELISGGANDMFLVAFDSNGNLWWATGAGGRLWDYGTAVSTDAAGDIYATGSFYSNTIVFGNDTLINKGLYDIFLVKYDHTGRELWAKSVGGKYDDHGNSIATDRYGNVYLTGTFRSTSIIIGSDTLTNAGGNTDDLLILKYSGDGDLRWTKRAGGRNNDSGTATAVDTSGNIFVTGYFDSDTITFDAYTLMNANAFYDDLFLAKLKGNNTGINEIPEPEKIPVFPNPATDRIMLALPVGINATRISVLNISGQELLKMEIKESPVSIDVSKLPGGIYFIRVTGKQYAQVQKFIKQ
jgi:hypothetical protein